MAIGVVKRDDGSELDGCVPVRIYGDDEEREREREFEELERWV